MPDQCPQNPGGHSNTSSNTQTTQDETIIKVSLHNNTQRYQSNNLVLDVMASGAQLTQSPQIVPVQEMPINHIEEFKKLLKSLE